jgi:hypothetical protein
VGQRSHDTPAWRIFGAAIGAFAIVVQLLFAAWLIVDAAGASQAALAQADLGVICTHDPAAAADNTGAPPAPHPHGQCLACACPQSGELLAALPTPSVVAVLRPHSLTLPAYGGAAVPPTRSPAPYASRAPPFSA